MVDFTNTKVRSHTRRVNGRRVPVRRHDRRVKQGNPRPMKTIGRRSHSSNPALNPFIGKQKLTEQEVRLLMRRLNAGAIKPSELQKIFPDDGSGLNLTIEQQEKGRQWLINQWQTPAGIERKNNPFGLREEAVLENFSELRLKDVWSERGNFYTPVYQVVSKDGNTFEYTVTGGRTTIIG